MEENMKKQTQSKHKKYEEEMEDHHSKSEANKQIDSQKF